MRELISVVYTQCVALRYGSLSKLIQRVIVKPCGFCSMSFKYIGQESQRAATLGELQNVSRLCAFFMSCPALFFVYISLFLLEGVSRISHVALKCFLHPQPCIHVYTSFCFDAVV